jgi:hypothetical protein
MPQCGGGSGVEAVFSGINKNGSEMVLSRGVITVKEPVGLRGPFIFLGSGVFLSILPMSREVWPSFAKKVSEVLDHWDRNGGSL